MRTHWRFAIAALLLAGTGLLLHARNGSEIIPARMALTSFPRTFQDWTSTDIPLQKDVLDVLGPGDFLVRDYHAAAGDRNVALFIAYFPSQRAGDTIHSPKNCLPGAGWVPVQSDRITIDSGSHAPFVANRYVIAQGEQRQLVLYWYWAHDRAVAGEYAAKFYLVTDSIRMHRSDGSLVRVSTPLTQGESIESAQKVLLSFAGNIIPVLNTYVPR
jgi:EpsI family protein